MAKIKEQEVLNSPESKVFENLAEKLDKKQLDRISDEVMSGFESDLETMQPLFNSMEQYIPLVSLQYEKKNTPFQNSSNVKLPTMTSAIYNFQARASLNTFRKDDDIVQTLPLSRNEDVVFASRRVKQHMNWQLMTMPNFFEGFNKTYALAARDGYAIRKTYWDNDRNQVMSTYVDPYNFITNYYTRSLETSMRYTQILEYTTNEVLIKMDQGLYKRYDNIEDVTYDNKQSMVSLLAKENSGQTPPSKVDYTTPREVLECHTFVSLNDDKIRRPYIITIDKITGNVLRIVDRSNPETGQTMNYFTLYTLLPNPDSIFGFGFGRLLLGPTSAMNTTTNQMIDAVTLSNTQCGFSLKGSKLSKGTQSFSMGEFKQVEVRGDDIRKVIFPLDFKPPSSVTFSLLSFLQGYVDRLTTVTDVFTGQAPKSDTTATGAMLAVENGAKQFTAIQKDMNRSFQSELKKIADLNSIYLDPSEYNAITGDYEFSIDDYRQPLSFIPVADPTVISDAQIAQKAQALVQVVNSNPFLQQSPEAQKLITIEQLKALNVNDNILNTLSMDMDRNIQSMAQQEEELMQQEQMMSKASQLDKEAMSLKEEERFLIEQLNKSQPQSNTQ